jgi:hypothetical protein
MNANVLMMGWNRPVNGREETAGQLFQEFTRYLGGLQQAGQIRSFDTVLLNPHGGDLNGFFLIRGADGEIDALASSEEWMTYMTRAGVTLEGVGVVRGATGNMVGQWMDVWNKVITS